MVTVPSFPDISASARRRMTLAGRRRDMPVAPSRWCAARLLAPGMALWIAGLQLSQLELAALLSMRRTGDLIWPAGGGLAAGGGVTQGETDGTSEGGVTWVH